jgi:integrase
LKYLRENIAKLYANKGYRRNMLFLLSKMEKQKGWKSKPTSEVLTKENLLNLLYGHAQGTYFNTQRAHLVALMGKLIDIGILKQNPMTGVSKVSAKPSKNVAFDKQQLKNLFEAMSDQYPNLYLGCLLMYTTLLRPNKEIRSLKRKFFSDDLSMLVIPDHYTKNKNGRNVPLSQHTIEELQKFGIHKLEPEDNIFGHQYNDEYFTQVWGKFRRKNPNLIKPGQTLYSIRHTAALEIYRKTNSVQKVKIAMDHSDIVMTIKYLRSLDIFETLIDVNDLPEIDF